MARIWESSFIQRQVSIYNRKITQIFKKVQPYRTFKKIEGNTGYRKDRRSTSPWSLTYATERNAPSKEHTSRKYYYK